MWHEVMTQASHRPVGPGGAGGALALMLHSHDGRMAGSVMLYSAASEAFSPMTPMSRGSLSTATPPSYVM